MPLCRIYSAVERGGDWLGSGAIISGVGGGNRALAFRGGGSRSKRREHRRFGGKYELLAGRARYREMKNDEPRASAREKEEGREGWRGKCRGN